MIARLPQITALLVLTVILAIAMTRMARATPDKPVVEAPVSGYLAE